MQTYLSFLRHILTQGTQKMDRTGTGTISTFGYQMRFDLQQGFPLITTKKIHLKSVICELLWFLRGDTNIDYLRQHGVSIWDAWADAQGELGPIYGYQWRSWPSERGPIDQLQQLITNLQSQPDSRRHIISAWNVGQIQEMALPPCHVLFQFYVAKGQLSCQLYQRSADVFLGVPFNIASYALLTHLIAKQCGYQVGEFIWTGGDCHIYVNHLSQVELQLSRAPYQLPTLTILHDRPSIFEHEVTDFAFNHYQHHPAIKAPIAV